MESRRSKEEIFELIYKTLTDEPQSIGKIATKTGLNWRTVSEYIDIIEMIQTKGKVRITKNPTLIWYIEE